MGIPSFVRGSAGEAGTALGFGLHLSLIHICSELTPEARRLIAIYEELQKQLDEQAASLLDELLR